MRIQRSRDCGNSPKNVLLEDLAVALLSGDVDRTAELITDDVTWQVSGDVRDEERAAVLGRVGATRPRGAGTLAIQHVVSHGRAGAVTATVTRAKSPAEAVCLVFTFENAKGKAVGSIVTYRLG